MRDSSGIHPLVGPLTRLFQRLNKGSGLDIEIIVRGLVDALERGDVCVPWRSLFDTFPDPATLALSGLIGSPSDPLPLVLDAGGRLYLRHFHLDEKNVARAVTHRVLASPPLLDTNWIDDALERFFPASEKGDLQRLAAQTALNGWFTIISGGPGTGKTHTVLTILALLIEQATHTASRPLHIALLAPTGKAAARLKESITQSIDRLQLSESTKNAIPLDTQTIHRWLGSVDYDRRQRPNDSYAAVDVVVVDEASMVDLPLFARLIAAIPSTARLILLGDRNQLAPVEAGSVLGDLTKAGTLQPASPLGRRIVELQTSRRFGPDSGIGNLARAILEGNIAHTREVLTSISDVKLVGCREATGLRRIIGNTVIDHFQKIARASDPAAAFAILGKLRLLAAINDGPFGVHGINATITRLLGLENAGVWYHGRPILITENDHPLGLFNGDTGIAWKDSSDDGELRVWFPADEAGVLRQFAPSALPAHETAYAITVHRSQGSEFDHVCIVLPPVDSIVVTRELLYTAVTRARKQVTLVCEENLLSLFLDRSLVRVSGLQDYFIDET